MNFTYIFLPILCLNFLFAPDYTDFAKTKDDLNFYLIDSVNFLCPPKDESKITLGCIFFKIKTVFILRDLSEEGKSFVIAHEVGHYYLYGVQTEDLEEMISSGKSERAAAFNACMTCRMAKDKEKSDAVELSATLYYDYLYNRGYLEDSYPEIKKLYDNLLSM